MPTPVWIVCAFIVGAWLNPNLPIGDDRRPTNPAITSPVGSMAPIPSPVAAWSTSTPPLGTAGPAIGRAVDDLPDCTYAGELATADPGGDWVLALIDTTYRLPAGYRPDDLVPVARAGLDGGGQVREIVADDLEELADAAVAAGNPLAVQSGFRSEARQGDIFAGWVASHGEAAARRFSARPGHPEHQLGTAVDFRAAAGSAPWDIEFEDTKAGRWLAVNAATYGFVMSYPADAERESCYGYEPWHFRWVGRSAAAEVAASGGTLRAWLWAASRRS